MEKTKLKVGFKLEVCSSSVRQNIFDPTPNHVLLFEPLISLSIRSLFLKIVLGSLIRST